VGVALSGLLYVWTAWFQGYIYSEPTGQLYWRAPAAGAALMVYLALWVLLDYRSPGSFQVFTQYGSSAASKPYDEMKVVAEGEDPVLYKRKPVEGGRYVYRDEQNRVMPSRPDKIIVMEGDKEVVFEPERDAKGKFKRETGGSLLYRDSRGRTMSEASLGEVATSQGVGFFLDLIVNVLYAGVWFVCLWLLLRFQWPHALLQALVAWLVILLFVVAPLLNYAEHVATKT
jgi:hypothetical protein